MADQLKGALLKIDRAQKHLNEITGMLSLLKHGECRTIPEYGEDSNLFIQRIEITPKPPAELSAVAGDFLFAVRSALDHLVWQLVIANGETPTTSTMFPIESDPTKFIEVATNRKRLRGVATAACAVIEGLQPYHAGNDSLQRLNTLHNEDKHRGLNLTTVVADNTSLITYRAGVPVFSSFIGDEELRDDAVFGNFGMPLDNPVLLEMFPNIRNSLSQMEVKGQASLFVAFDEAGAASLEGFEVELTLSEILKFVKETVIPRFIPLFA